MKRKTTTKKRANPFKKMVADKARAEKATKRRRRKAMKQADTMQRVDWL